MMAFPDGASNAPVLSKHCFLLSEPKSNLAFSHALPCAAVICRAYLQQQQEQEQHQEVQQQQQEHQLPLTHHLSQPLDEAL